MHQGEAVSINYSSVDASAGAPVILKGADGKVRVLAKFERLQVDALFCNVVTAALSADVFATADDTTDPDVIIGSFGVGQPNEATYPHEGFGVPLGVTPTIKAGHSGQVTLTGSGRIINGSTQTGRLSWRERASAGQ